MLVVGMLDDVWTVEETFEVEDVTYVTREEDALAVKETEERAEVEESTYAVAVDVISVVVF